MIEQKQSFDQLPAEIKPAFQELKVIKHLNNAGFKKKFGQPARSCFGLSLFYFFTRRIGFGCSKAARVNHFQAKTPPIGF